MKVNKLKGKIIEKGMTVEEVAEKMGINKATFYRKLKLFENFTIGEATKIKSILCLTDQEAFDIFLA